MSLSIVSQQLIKGFSEMNCPGDNSEPKFRMLLICHCPIHRLNLVLDPRQVIAAKLIGGGVLKALDDGTTLANELVAYDS
jgi:hypothetical protein